MKFEDIDWHDQVLLELKLDRSNPGHFDIVELRFLIDDVEVKMLFNRVYFALLNMNFGIAAEESIYYAEVIEEDDEINQLKNKWNSFNLQNLKCFVFNTNSTNSVIKIYATSYLMTKV